MKTVIQIIKKQRDSGATLRQIGDEVGCSYENIRLQLIKHYGTADIEYKGRALLTTLQLANLVNCSITLIGNFYRRGVISPIASHYRLWLWDSKAVSILLRVRSCRICSRLLPKGKFVFCSYACRLEGGKYKNRPEEQRKKHNELVRRWMREHPERTREIQDAAVKRYQAKQGVWYEYMDT